MRLYTGGVAHIACIIEADLSKRKTNLHKPHISGLSDIAASVLSCHSVNTSELSSILPRSVKSDEERYRYINRILSNSLIDPVSVMNGYVPEVIDKLSSNGQAIVLMLDQSKISKGFECLMLSLRMGNRAIPVAWRVIQTYGAIGFDVQEPLLNAVLPMIPSNISVMFSADRFYGTSALVNWCQNQSWQYRIRLKGNLIFQHDNSEITGNDAVKLKLDKLENATFNNTNVTTNIGIVNENGHKQPWIIAMDCQPSKYRTLDYGMRWGIESLFSDLKSRGFGITKTQLKHPERIERLMLVLAIATYWAVSTGMKPDKNQKKYTKKNA